MIKKSFTSTPLIMFSIQKDYLKMPKTALITQLIKRGKRPDITIARFVLVLSSSPCFVANASSCSFADNALKNGKNRMKIAHSASKSAPQRR